MTGAPQYSMIMCWWAHVFVRCIGIDGAMCHVERNWLRTFAANLSHVALLYRHDNISLLMLTPMQCVCVLWRRCSDHHSGTATSSNLSATLMNAQHTVAMQQQEQLTLATLAVLRYLERAPRSSTILRAVKQLSRTGVPCRTIVAAPGVGHTEGASA